MNKTATSRQALLEAAREIARRDGLGHISIRRTACLSALYTIIIPPRRTLCWL